MQEIVDEFVAQPRFNMVLLGLFAGIALVLAAIGVYGVMAYSVTQRTREIGIRVALGATPSEVLMNVLAQAGRLSAIGLVAGLFGAFAATRLLGSLLYGVKPMDALVYSEMAILMFGIAMLASYIPARRATKVDPMTALRVE